MFEHRTKLRVRYAEVDRMGYVYYGNYAQYYEVGRVEAMRALGLDYAQLEEHGIMMPVVKMECLYHRPLRYDQRITVVTRIVKLPRARMDFHYELLNEDGEVLNTGFTQLVFVHRDTMRPTRAPQEFLDALTPHISP
ncbi:MAG: acyl-CoA thioesterase [Flavobacteriales bacterium]|nr:acyl-CoA thioesterase [Flavobacteriales bacterium]